MSRPVTLPAFTSYERERVHSLLALRVAQMMGRKLEEDDWSSAYCSAKGIENRGWSNLNIDVVHNNLGVEHKMLCYGSRPTLDEACGTTLMHPSLTRSIRISSIDEEPNEVMRDVFAQYGELVEQRRRYVENQDPTGQPVDLRIGWLLWQSSLRQFLYFEERNSAPDPDDYYALWADREGRGARKGSKNLWIYERESGQKRYSVTTSAGIKIQPYFDVPPPSDPNLYMFTVIGERIQGGLVRVAITQRTANALARIVGSLHEDALSEAVAHAISRLPEGATALEADRTDEVVFLHMTEQAYRDMQERLPGANDEHCFQLLVDLLTD